MGLECVLQRGRFRAERELLGLTGDLFEQIRAHEARVLLGKLEPELGEVRADGIIQLVRKTRDGVALGELRSQPGEALRLILPIRPVLAVVVDGPEKRRHGARGRGETE